MDTLKRRPTHPGEILRLEFLKPLKMTQRELAKKVGYEIKAINRLVNERSRVNPKIAKGLAKVFGTTPQFWLKLQIAVDLWDEDYEVQIQAQTSLTT